MTHLLTRTARRATLLMALAMTPSLVTSCREASGAANTALPAARAFEDLWQTVSTTTLDWNKDSTGLLIAGLQRGSRLMLVDADRGELRIHALPTGKLVKVAATPGVNEGDLREPTAIEPLDSGRFVVYDTRRHLASFRDSTGAMISEARLPLGYYGGFMALPAERRIVLTGFIAEGVPAANGKDIHEFDYQGKHIRSYGTRAKPKSNWHSRFAAELGILDGDRILTGTMNGSRVRVVSRSTMKEQWIDIAPGWQKIDWPDDKLLKANRNTIAMRIMKWRRNQPLMDGVLALGGSRVLVSFRKQATDGGDLFYHVLADTSGRTLAITRASRKRAVATSGDTIRWIEGAPGRQYTYGLSVVPR